MARPPSSSSRSAVRRIAPPARPCGSAAWRLPAAAAPVTYRPHDQRIPRFGAEHAAEALLAQELPGDRTRRDQAQRHGVDLAPRLAPRARVGRIATLQHPPTI